MKNFYFGCWIVNKIKYFLINMFKEVSNVKQH